MMEITISLSIGGVFFVGRGYYGFHKIEFNVAVYRNSGIN